MGWAGACGSAPHCAVAPAQQSSLCMSCCTEVVQTNSCCCQLGSEVAAASPACAPKLCMPVHHTFCTNPAFLAHKPSASTLSSSVPPPAPVAWLQQGRVLDRMRQLPTVVVLTLLQGGSNRGVQAVPVDPGQCHRGPCAVSMQHRVCTAAFPAAVLGSIGAMRFIGSAPALLCDVL
jgi:hypothetical protein